MTRRRKSSYEPEPVLVWPRPATFGIGNHRRPRAFCIGPVKTGDGCYDSELSGPSLGPTVTSTASWPRVNGTSMAAAAG